MTNEQQATAEQAVFNADQLFKLGQEFAKLDTVNPTSPTFLALRDKINTLPLYLLEQVSAANIKWMSYLADQAIAEKAQ